MRDGIRSALAVDCDGAPYDRHARIYDRLIGNAAYNRIAWAARPEQYAAFAAEALRAGSGPFLDAGCGTAVFTAEQHRRSSRPLVLVDLSLGMFERAADRLADRRAQLVQADLLDLPFAPGGFETIGCFAMLHVLDEPWAVLGALREQLAPGGRLFASMLVGDRVAGRAYMAALRGRGELGPARTSRDLAAAAQERFETAAVDRIGSMAYLRASRGGGRG